MKKEYLEKLKQIILEEDDKTPKFSLDGSSSSLTTIYKQFPIPNPFQQITTKDLQREINQIKNEVKYLKDEVLNLKTNDLTLEAKLALLQNPPQQVEIPASIPLEISQIADTEISTQQFIQTISKITFQKWFSIVSLIVEDFSTNTVALIDSGADVNCIKRGIVPTKYCEKSNEGLASANGSALHINYKLNKGYIKVDDYCFKNTFLIVDNMTSDLILGTPFLTQIYPFYVNEIGLHTQILGKTISFKFLTTAKQKEIASLQSASIYKQINAIHVKQNLLNSLKEEVSYLRIEEKLQNPTLQRQIFDLEQVIKQKICADLPNAFWERKQHIITLPYEKGFNEKQIPTKARPTQMNAELLEYCKKEIQSLLDKKLIRPSKSPWSCAAFYVNNAPEKERGVPRLVINYKPLNKVLQWIRYPIPNKRDLLNRLYAAKIFSKFDMKSGFWQIQIAEPDRYKTAFTVPFGHYEWNVMPFGLKNAPSEFQNIMNDIFTPYTSFIIAVSYTHLTLPTIYSV